MAPPAASGPHPQADDDDDALEAQAEEVRAYLVSIRGGAPFLSGADARLLVSWLDKRVPVPLILAAVDRVALRRRKRRTRSRLTLNACKGEVNKALGARPARPRPAPARGSAGTGPHAPHPGLTALAASFAEMPVSPGLAEARAALVARVQTAAGSGASDEDAGRMAIAACRAFQDAAWIAAAAEHAALQTQAEAQLSALRSALSDTAFAAAVEEVARDLVRARHPRVCAQDVWDSLDR